MHYSIFSTKDSWISSGSDLVTGVTQRDQNFGLDEILELKKFYYNNSLDHQTRTLVDFSGTDFTNMSQSIVDGTITNPKFYLRLYEAEGNQELSTDYTIAAFPISESWAEGIGKFGDSPKVTNGVSWIYKDNYTGATATSWNNSVVGEGVSYISSSASVTSQSFSSESPDIEMDVTRTVNKWLDGTNSNYGFLLRFSGSQETDSSSFGQMKFFSRNTNTIYAPKLEVRWDDHLPCTGSNTGSLVVSNLTGTGDKYIYMTGLKDSYKESDKIKFRLKVRERYIQKTFNTSVQDATGSYIPEGSGSYAIKDIATDEYIIPFGDYTKLSCDGKSNYFIQWLNGFYPNRVYKIIYKLKYNDGQEEIFDNGFEFKVKR